MKEKRYFCDSWFFDKTVTLTDAMKIVICTSLIVMVIVSSVIWYHILIYNHREEIINSYSERDYEYLDEIATEVIEKDKGINEIAIPKDIVEYEITRKDGKITFKYYLDSSKEDDWIVSASMKVTLSENFEILSKEPNYSSRKEYIKEREVVMFFSSIILGFVFIIPIMLIIGAIILVAYLISLIQKNRDNRQ